MTPSQAGVDDLNPDAPFNQHEPDPTYHCHECSEPVPDVNAEEALRWIGDVWCDRCLVANSESCGDWDDISIAAKERLNQNQQ